MGHPTYRAAAGPAGLTATQMPGGAGATAMTPKARPVSGGLRPDPNGGAEMPPTTFECDWRAALGGSCSPRVRKGEFLARRRRWAPPDDLEEIAMPLPTAAKDAQRTHRGAPEPWNRGKLIGQKPPLKLREVWAIRVRLQIAGRLRDLAMFNLAIASKLRGCDLVALRVDDVLLAGRVRPRATVLQKKTGRPVQFEITKQTRDTVMQWITKGNRKQGDHLFPSRVGKNSPLTTRHYARLMAGWVGSIGLDPALYGTHSLRRTKAALIYRRTGNLRAVQLPLGHTKIESTVRYLGVEVDGALAISEQIDI